MIKVSEEIDLVTQEYVADVCELVELWPCGFYCRPSITTPETLRVALQDVEKDGVNTWFWENGRFTWSIKEKFWSWEATSIAAGSEA